MHCSITDSAVRVFWGSVLLIVLPSASLLSQERSQLEIDSTGWLDLMPNSDLKKWKRVGLELGLAAKNPWSTEQGILVCRGEGAKEMFLYDQLFDDGVFHLEWRFRKLEGKQDYNSGAYVRSLDGAVWHQVQIAHLEKPPLVGDIFGDMPVAGKTQRVVVEGKGSQHINAPGQWNTFEITAVGKEIRVWINGHTTLTWNDCAVSKGFVGLQAEFFTIEFRSVKFKPLAK